MPTALRRCLSAWLLLASFVPMMVLAGAHVHGPLPEDLSCKACVHHLPHPGHLASSPGQLHGCVLCQLLGSAFVAGAEEWQAAAPAAAPSEGCAACAAPQPGRVGRGGPRAPPVAG